MIKLKGDINMTEVKNVTIEEIIEKQIENYGKQANIELIKKAYHMAKTKHGNQCRMSGEAYIIHPMNVAYILANLEMDAETICAALLHDVVEDTDLTHEDLVREFGETIAQMVAGVTKLGTIRFTSVEEKQAENYRKMCHGQRHSCRFNQIGRPFAQYAYFEIFNPRKANGKC